MIEDGLFDRFPVQAVYAMHNWPGACPGTVGINPGPMMAAADRITIEITGRAGTVRTPTLPSTRWSWLATSSRPCRALCRATCAHDSAAVISLCAMQAGDLGTMSVIPGKATLVGTVRTFNPMSRTLSSVASTAVQRHCPRARGDGQRPV